MRRDAAPATEVAWAAGFFDGEGYIGITFSGAERWARVQLCITQHNREPLDRFARAVSLGRIYGPWPDGKGRLVRYHLRVAGIEAVRQVFLTLAPYLSTPKRDQAVAALDAWAASRVGPKVDVTCEECGATVERQLGRGLQPNLRYCSPRCRKRAANRRQRQRAAQ